MKLGECQSKCEHIAGVPLQPATATRLHLVYLAKGSHATTAIEGNTLSEEEVLRRVEGTLQLPPSREYLGQEVDNILKACNELLEQVQTGEMPGLDPRRIAELNRLVLDNLTVDEQVKPGEIRSHEVSVAHYQGAPAKDCSYLLEQLCQWLNSGDFKGQPEQLIAFAIIRAVLAHLYLAWIHPFSDGNGRVARLVEFQILISSGVPAPAAHLLSNHYNLTRSEYYRRLDQARENDGVLRFLGYAVQGLLDGLREQLEDIRKQQWGISWRDYVYEAFRVKRSKANDRRRDLLLDLSERGSVPLHDVRNLTPRTAAAYTNRTSKTLSRDINALVSMGLVEKKGSTVRARRELILAFLPLRSQT